MENTGRSSDRTTEDSEDQHSEADSDSVQNRTEKGNIDRST